VLFKATVPDDSEIQAYGAGNSRVLEDGENFVERVKNSFKALACFLSGTAAYFTLVEEIKRSNKLLVDQV
jgi:hypothetical protein